jgi:hypothetical protein
MRSEMHVLARCRFTHAARGEFLLYKVSGRGEIYGFGKFRQMLTLFRRAGLRELFTMDFDCTLLEWGPSF